MRMFADVLDGDLYEQQCDGSIFKGTDQDARQREVHISLQMNMDGGLSFFRSSTYMQSGQCILPVPNRRRH